jgi:hypothetical protein
MARLKDRYNDEIRDALVAKFGYSTPMQAPRLLKVTLNMGVGEAKQDSKMLDAALGQLADIAGQKPTKATMQGGIQDKAMPIHVSNLMLVCGKDGPVKVGYRVDPNGEKHRVCRKCGAEL